MRAGRRSRRLRGPSRGRGGRWGSGGGGADPRRAEGLAVALARRLQAAGIPARSPAGCSDGETAKLLGESAWRAVCVVTHDDVLALRLTLLSAHLRPDVPLWVTMFDRTVTRELRHVAPAVHVLSPAELVARGPRRAVRGGDRRRRHPRRVERHPPGRRCAEAARPGRLRTPAGPAGGGDRDDDRAARGARRRALLQHPLGCHRGGRAGGRRRARPGSRPYRRWTRSPLCCWWRCSRPRSSPPEPSTADQAVRASRGAGPWACAADRIRPGRASGWPRSCSAAVWRCSVSSRTRRPPACDSPGGRDPGGDRPGRRSRDARAAGDPPLRRGRRRDLDRSGERRGGPCRQRPRARAPRSCCAWATGRSPPRRIRCCTWAGSAMRTRSRRTRSWAAWRRRVSLASDRVQTVNSTLIAELPAKVGEQVTVRGWVNALRDQKRVQFVILRDETGMAQAVLGKGEEPSELNDAISALTAESAVTLTGTVVADERVKLGGLELKIESLQVDSLAEPELPIAADSALDKRIDWRYLDLRRPDRRLIFEVQTAIERAMREFWREEGFIELHSPKLMGSASESGRGAVPGRLLRGGCVPGPVAPVLQADGDGRRLRQGVRGRAGVPCQPVLHLPSRHRVHERRHGALLDRLARGRDGGRGALARTRARRRQGEPRRADRGDVRDRADRAHASLPAHHAGGRQGDAARAGPRRARRRATTWTRPASARSRR